MTHLVHLEIHPALCISRVSRAAVDADGLAEVIEARPLRPFRVVAESTYLNSGLGTTASREWSESSDAPQNEFARLRAARVRTEDGRVTQKADIRQPLYLEVEYQVLKGGHALLPAFGVYNEEGLACS